MASPYYTVNASTSYLQIPSSNLSTTAATAGSTIIVYFSSLNTPGSIITIRDSQGSIGELYPIVLSTTQDITFLDGTFSTLITQPYGFITLSPKTPEIWNFVNTFAFPDAQAAAVINTLNANVITTSSLYVLDKAELSSANISSLSTESLFVRTGLQIEQSTVGSNAVFFGKLQVGHEIFTPSTLFVGERILASSLAIQGTGIFKSSVQISPSTGVALDVGGSTIIGSHLLGRDGARFAGNLEVQGSFLSNAGMLSNTGASFFTGPMTILGTAPGTSNSLNLSNSLRVESNAIVVGTAEVGDVATFSNDTNALGRLLVSKDGLFYSSITVEGSVSTQGSIVAAGNFSTGGAAGIGGSAWVRGGLSTGAGLMVGSFLSTASNVAVGLNLDVASSVSVGKDLRVVGDVNIGGTINAGGITSSNLNLAGALTVALSTTLFSSLTVWGNISTASSLLVSCNARFGGSVTTGGALSTGGALFVGGSVSTLGSAAVAGNLAVAGNASTNGALAVGGSVSTLGGASFGSPVFVNSRLVVTENVSTFGSVFVGASTVANAMVTSSIQASSFFLQGNAKFYTVDIQGDPITTSTAFALFVGPSTVHAGLFSTVGNVNVGGSLSTQRQLVTGSTLHASNLTLYGTGSTLSNLAVGGEFRVQRSTVHAELMSNTASTVLAGANFVTGLTTFSNAVTSFSTVTLQTGSAILRIAGAGTGISGANIGLSNEAQSNIFLGGLRTSNQTIVAGAQGGGIAANFRMGSNVPSQGMSMSYDSLAGPGTASGGRVEFAAASGTNRVGGFTFFTAVPDGITPTNAFRAVDIDARGTVTMTVYGSVTAGNLANWGGVRLEAINENTRTGLIRFLNPNTGTSAGYFGYSLAGGYINLIPENGGQGLYVQGNTWTTGNTSNAGNLSNGGKIYIFDNGSAGAPSLTWPNPADNDSGFYHPADGTIRGSINGVDRLEINTGGARIYGQTDLAAVGPGSDNAHLKVGTVSPFEGGCIAWNRVENGTGNLEIVGGRGGVANGFVVFYTSVANNTAAVVGNKALTIKQPSLADTCLVNGGITATGATINGNLIVTGTLTGAINLTFPISAI